ncbi:MAG: hypothetical protein IPK82_40455 [Polyangiaceae bacterium]|nr:hypothetical protein [Polyangiaceae bacterium]
MPALLARGEAARKAGDSPSAAADFNRALALRPQDLAILKRITSLSASRNRRALLRRAAIVGATSITLGLVSFAVVKLVRERPVGPEISPTTSTSSAAQVEPTQTAEPDTDMPDEDPMGPPEASGKPKTRVYTPPVVSIAATTTTTTSPQNGRPSTRKVRFTVIPAGGKLWVDGLERAWLSGPFELPFGSHAVRVTVPEADCCDELNGPITVTRPPPDSPEGVEHFTLRVPLRPATIRLVGAPANAQLLCTRLGVSVAAGQSASVKLPDTPWTGTCEFRPPQADATPKKGSVTLRAGRSNDVPWPG